MAQYSITVKNESATDGHFVLYQTPPNVTGLDPMSLAWFSKGAPPSTGVSFNWETNYGFVWGESGVLQPGVVFEPSQSWPADLATSNRVSFGQSQGGYQFQDPGRGPVSGNLYIHEDGTVRPNVAAVGIAMAGSATFVQPAFPNTELVFTTTPNYWIAFGQFSQGQVLDPTTIVNAQQLVFPPASTSLAVTLKQDGTWSVVPA